ncbi:ATP-binding protein [Pseudarthrobacter sp. P1]|uniref:ATP-binding protein n=1 Tax=Pseudarthrobacter sp. P1 TaxID=3418418 RepID=UPI003CF13427
MGYIPFESDAVHLFFQLAPSRSEHAALILASNLGSAHWGELLGGQIAAAAMTERIVHDGEAIVPKGSSFRL